MKKLTIILAISCLIVTFTFPQESKRIGNDSLKNEANVSKYFNLQSDSLIEKLILGWNGSKKENKLYYLSPDYTEGYRQLEKIPNAGFENNFPINIMRPEGSYPMKIMKPDSSQRYYLLIKKI